MELTRPRVGLFVTCLVDLFRPSVGFASVKLLEEAGCNVEVPENQTCCGQPAFNSGDRKDTADIARQLLNADASAETLAAIEKGLEGKQAAPGLIAGVLISSPEFQRR